MNLRNVIPSAAALLLLCPGRVLDAQPVNTSNRVLELDGKGSYVELPPNIFKDLEEATVESDSAAFARRLPAPPFDLLSLREKKNLSQ